MLINVKANSTATSIFGTNKNYDSLVVVPSAVMRSASSDFNKESKLLNPLGIFGIDITSTDANLLINALEGFFDSANGRHYIKLKENATLDLATLINESYQISIEVVYNEPDLGAGDYPFTDINFHILKATEDLIGTKLSSFAVVGGVIGDIVLEPTTTIEQSLRDKIDTYTRDEIDNNLSTVENNLIQLIQNIAVSNAQGQFGENYDPVLELSPTPITLTFGIDKQSTETDMFEINANNTITFKQAGDFNYLSSVTFQSEGSQSGLETITFSVVNIANEEVLLSVNKPINITGTDTSIVPFNTLFDIPESATFPMTVRIDVVSTGSDYTLNTLTSILLSSNDVGLIATAKGITYDNTKSGSDTTNVQDRLDEINSNLSLVSNIITEDVIIPSGKNGILSQPLEIATGVVIDVAENSSLTIIK